jgi:hypothetical protein
VAAHHHTPVTSEVDVKARPHPSNPSPLHPFPINRLRTQPISSRPEEESQQSQSSPDIDTSVLSATCPTGAVHAASRKRTGQSGSLCRTVPPTLGIENKTITLSLRGESIMPRMTLVRHCIPRLADREIAGRRLILSSVMSANDVDSNSFNVDANDEETICQRVSVSRG